MELILSLIAERVQERPDGRLDAAGVITELGAPGFPAAQENVTAVFVLSWSAEEHGRQAFRADLMDEAGERVGTLQGHVDVERRAPDQPPVHTKMLFPIERIIFPHPGGYHFELVAGGESRRACSLHVARMER